MTLLTIDSIVRNFDIAFTIWIIYYVAVISSSIIGSIISNRVKRLNLLYFWMVLGVISSLSPIFTKNFQIINVSISCFLLGVSFGLGMPSSLAYFADYTLIENRGRVSGIIFLAANFGAFPLTVLFMKSNFVQNSLTLAIWRAFGLILFLSLKPRDKYEDQPEKGHQTSFASVFHDKAFILYLIPWTMFIFIDRLLVGFFGPEFVDAIIGSISALVGGILADEIGRKRVVVYGFILLGIAYGIVGIAPNVLLFRYLYLILDGCAAGILWVTCILILWGDLSKSGMREKYYLIGNIPFFFTRLVTIFLSPYITLIPVNATFSLASFFLFLAVLPLLYAPETLPERKIRLRQLRSYVEAAKKAREKYLKKTKRS
jgi:MFS family permease